ncbi:hypothetical protein ACSFA0_22475 [Variovorax sp. LT1P1]|uniref:hypothetical protein n=1 Tax=Variovorax sp. LT1P1 TaxID=3443730 RepID=UPI003F46ACB3
MKVARMEGFGLTAKMALFLLTDAPRVVPQLVRQCVLDDEPQGLAVIAEAFAHYGAAMAYESGREVAYAPAALLLKGSLRQRELASGWMQRFAGDPAEVRMVLENMLRGRQIFDLDSFAGLLPFGAPHGDGAYDAAYTPIMGLLLERADGGPTFFKAGEEFVKERAAAKCILDAHWAACGEVFALGGSDAQADSGDGLFDKALKLDAQGEPAWMAMLAEVYGETDPKFRAAVDQAFVNLGDDFSKHLKWRFGIFLAIKNSWITPERASALFGSATGGDWRARGVHESATERRPFITELAAALRHRSHAYVDEVVNAWRANGVDLDMQVRFSAQEGGSLTTWTGTLLHEAVQHHGLRLVELLLDLGADPSRKLKKEVQTLTGHTVVDCDAFDLAEAAGEEMASLLRSWKARNQVRSLLATASSAAPG